MPGEMVSGFTNLGGGMNGAAAPSVLPENQYSRGINLTVRGGFPRTRPALVEEAVPGMPVGVPQGAGTWSLASGDRIVFVVSGRIYVLWTDTLAVMDMGPGMNPANQCFVSQVDRYALIQDGNSTPIVLEDVSGVPQFFAGMDREESLVVAAGDTKVVLQYSADRNIVVTYTPTAGTATIMDPALDYLVDGVQINFTTPLPSTGKIDVTYTADHSIPIGYMSIYAHGRLHLVGKYLTNTTTEGRDSIISGDIKLPNEPSTVLQFTETEYLNGGGAHGMPMEMGFIGGLGVYRNAHTGTGNGEVVAFGRNGVCAFDFSLYRETQWTTSSLSRVLFFGAGCSSPWSIVSINDDLVYRGNEGLRVLRYSVSQMAGNAGGLSNVPMSIEVSTFLQNDSAYLPFVSCATSDNRLYTTAGGATSEGATEFRGLVSWDLAAAYYNGITGLGVYDGMWTGDRFAFTVTALRDGAPTTYVFARGPILYRIDAAATTDVSLTRGVKPIEAQLFTRGYNFQDVTTTKQFQYIELWLADLRMDTQIEVFIRPVGYPLWKPLGTREFKVGDGSLPQIRRKLRFSVDFGSQSCDPSTSEPLFVATEFQIAVKWTGYARIERMRVVSEPVGEPPPSVCSETEAVVLQASEASGETLDDFSYSIRGL